MRGVEQERIEQTRFNIMVSAVCGIASRILLDETAKPYWTWLSYHFNSKNKSDYKTFFKSIIKQV